MSINLVDTGAQVPILVHRVYMDFSLSYWYILNIHSNEIPKAREDQGLPERRMPDRHTVGRQVCVSVSPCAGAVVIIVTTTVITTIIITVWVHNWAFCLSPLPESACQSWRTGRWLGLKHIPPSGVNLMPLSGSDTIVILTLQNELWSVLFYFWEEFVKKKKY